MAHDSCTMLYITQHEIYALPNGKESTAQFVVNATYNWWGTTSVSQINTRLRDLYLFDGSADVIFEQISPEPPKDIENGE